MRHFIEVVGFSVAALLGLAAATLSAPAVALEATEATVAAGKALAFDRRKGHCLACHAIAGGELPGNVGPALVAIKQRYPDKSKLRALVSDARINNPNTIMPPFGPNSLLADDEIDKVVEFVFTL